MTNGKILATGDLNTGEITRHTGTDTSLSGSADSASDGLEAKAAALSASAEASELKKKLKEFGFVEQEFPADGSFTLGGNLVN